MAGPSLSIEVVSLGGEAVTLLPTWLEFDAVLRLQAGGGAGRRGGRRRGGRRRGRRAAAARSGARDVSEAPTEPSA